eukprot:CAMPEP_0172409604 /NCGR_PEP_ID=MMETSP1061-20121228/76451_1 /TAXON_ID=37318 /ORGANISM="Pseudo-nitzschia pungens, Strain cf. pungens" /LENGTH=671 /DNA_ID=CAMNT_0013145763 /DNA_START=10 /DNA_END=2025 /DNA_ORIENTATION=+
MTVVSFDQQEDVRAGEGTATMLVLDQHEDCNWGELPEWVREAASMLGYSKKLWDRDKEPLTCEKDWEELTPSEKDAATRLGYTKELWDAEEDESSSSSSSSGESESEESCEEEADAAPSEISKPVPNFEGVHRHEKWTIYCIQLYTETKDYKFQIRDGIGISMHANRHLDANEIIIRDPVGPPNHEQLLQAPPLSDALSPEREAFAERFLDWYNAQRGKDRDGASNDSSMMSVTLEDFSNPPTKSSGLEIPPNEDNPSYELEIFENDIVIVEFIAPPLDPNYTFPTERRFEVLNFDEGLISDGEEDYSPEKMQRPPNICAMDWHDLELPGHFSNHACGSSSTAYDYFHSVSSEHDVLAAVTVRPSWIQDEIDARKQGHENNDTDHQMKARRALSPGEEITTDYVRWHWSNSITVPTSDCRRTPMGYFYGTEQGTKKVGKNADTGKRWEWDKLPSKVQRAGRILGYTKELWNDTKAKNPPMFEKKWKHLTAQEREAVILLTGHTKATWDNRDKNIDNSEDNESVSSFSTATAIDDLDWDELSQEQRRAATFVGHTKKTWDKDIELGHDHLYLHYLRPEVRDAFAILGMTESNWADDTNLDGEFGEAEPWFYCECGSVDCHASKEKGGFRGLKYLSLEEQKQLWPVTEPWIQQQLQWKFYQLKQQQEEKKTEE